MDEQLKTLPKYDVVDTWSRCSAKVDAEFFDLQIQVQLYHVISIGSSLKLYIAIDVIGVEKLPEHYRVERSLHFQDVGGKKVLMVGLCIGDPSIYSANSCPEPWAVGCWVRCWVKQYHSFSHGSNRDVGSIYMRNSIIF